MATLLRRLLGLLLLSCLHHSAESLTANLLVRPLSSASALCNDGSPAVYYVDLQPTSDEWVVVFPGGGACFDLQSCNDRWLNPGAGSLQSSTAVFSVEHSGSVVQDLFLASSAGRPDAIVGRTVLSSDAGQNPRFASANKVYVLYCSSDFWLGSNSSAFVNSSASSASSFAMRGASILRTLIADLIDDPLGLNGGRTLRTAASLTLVGVSAGAVGVLNHLSSITATVTDAHVNASLLDVRVIVDSGWFMDPSNGFAPQTSSAVTLYNMTQEEFPCLTVSSLPSASLDQGTSCCFLASCLTQNAAVTGFNGGERPVLFVNSLYDSFLSVYEASSSASSTNVVQQLSAALNGGSSDALQALPTDDLLSAASSLLDYGSSVNESVRMVLTNAQLSPNLHFFLVGCISHGLLAIVDDEQTATLGPLQQHVTHSTWTTLNSRNVSLQSAITVFADWQAGGRSTPVYLVDDSHNNPTCPEQYVGEERARDYPFATSSAGNQWIVGLSVLLLLLPLLVFFVTSALICCSYRPALRRDWKTLSQHTGSDRYLPRSEAFAPHTAHVSLSTRQLNYYPSKDALRRGVPVLRGVSMQPIVSGQLVGVIANSGGGKSTLLELLSCRRRFGLYTGELVVDGCGVSGEEAQQRWMRDHVSFVGQSGGSFLANLTVLENLQHAASIRLPDLSRSQRMQRIYSLLYDLKLLSVQHKRTGEDDVAGASTTSVNNDKGSISGGQRRRLALAVELLSSVPVVIMDEPTASLDSSAAHRLLRILQHLAVSQSTLIIVSIHQARSEILGLFDSVLLVAAGTLVYQGTPTGAVQHFTDALSQCDTGVKPEKRLALQRLLAESRCVGQGVNPADFLVDCLSNRYLVQQLERLPVSAETAAMREKDGGGALHTVVNRPQSNSLDLSDAPPIVTTLSASMAPISSFHSVCRLELHVALAMQSRRLLNMTRGEVWELFVMMTGLALILGDVFWQCTSHFAFATCLLLAVSVSIQATCSHIVESWYRCTKLYSQEVYGQAMQPRRLLLLLLPHHSFYGLLPVALCGFLVAWLMASPLSSALFDSGNAQFSTAWSILLKTLLVQTLCVQVFYLLFAFLAISFTRRVDLSVMQQLSCCLMAGALLLSGFLIMPSQMPFWLSLFEYVNPLHWAFLALLRINLPSSVQCASGQSVGQCAISQFDDGSTGWLALAFYEAPEANEYACLAILFAMSLFWLAAAYLALRRISRLSDDARSHPLADCVPRPSEEVQPSKEAHPALSGPAVVQAEEKSTLGEKGTVVQCATTTVIVVTVGDEDTAKVVECGRQPPSSYHASKC